MATVTIQKSERQYDGLLKQNKMKTRIGMIVLIAAYFLVILVMFILPFFSVPGYSIIVNTLSDLGAQSAPHGWIMNFLFVCLAAGSLMAGLEYYEGFVPHRIILVLFGISLILLSYFNHAPLNTNIQYNVIEDGWHAYFTCTAGLSFIILSIATIFILEKQQDRLLALTAGISAIFLAVLMSEADRFAGIWQRLMFIISFGWLIFNFKSR